MISARSAAVTLFISTSIGALMASILVWEARPFIVQPIGNFVL